MVKRNATRKVSKAEKKTRKASKGGKKTRKLSPKLREWNEKVMKLYREMKKKNPETRLGDAMKAAKRQ
jgi:hypothetical protein